MSYDISLWSVAPIRLPGSLPFPEQWQRDATGGFAYEKESWRIAIGQSAPVGPEDIPEEVMALLPGIRYFTEINLEPIHADRSAHSLLDKVVQHIAKDIHAVVDDGQKDEVTTPSGVKRYIQPKPSKGKERIDLLTLVVSSIYRDLWPALRDAASHEGDLSFVSTPDWQQAADLSALLGGVPREIAEPPPLNWLQRLLGTKRTALATSFPFPRTAPKPLIPQGPADEVGS